MNALKYIRELHHQVSILGQGKSLFVLERNVFFKLSDNWNVCYQNLIKEKRERYKIEKTDYNKIMVKFKLSIIVPYNDIFIVDSISVWYSEQNYEMLFIEYDEYFVFRYIQHGR